MSYHFILKELDGDNIGGILNGNDRKCTLGLNGNETATVKLRLDNPLANEVTSRNGDVLLCVFDDSTIKLTADLVTAEETGDESGHYLVCTFAGPLWRLTKRLTGKSTIPLSPSGSRSSIAWGLITGANLESDTGIRQGTLGTTVSTQTGPWQYKPIQEALSELAAVSSYAFEFTYLSRDDFGFSGNLAGRIPISGGTWEGAGDADDFTGSGTTELSMERNAVSDSSLTNGRYATLSNSITGAIQVQCDLRFTVGPYTGRLGVLARYTDPSNWVMVTMDPTASSALVVRKCVAGTETVLTSSAGSLNDQFYTMRLSIDTSGNWKVWFWQTASDPGVPGSLGAPLSGTDSDLATGGPLADGKVGIYDVNTSATAVRRQFDSFSAKKAYTHADDFGFTGGLHGRVAPMGGTWAGAGNPADFDGTGAGPTGNIGVSRSTGGATADLGVDSGRFQTLSASQTGAIYAHASQSFDIAPFTGRMGVVIRYTDTSNWLMASVEPLAAPNTTISIRKCVAGTITTLGQSRLPSLTSEGYNIRLQADASGNWAVWFWPAASTADPAAPLLTGDPDTDLATGGPLADGKVGLYDSNTSTTSPQRIYDGFFAAVPVETMGWQTLDFSFTPFEPVADVNEHSVAGVKIAEFNAEQVIGTDKTTTIFEAGGGNRGIKAWRHQISRDLINRAISLPSDISTADVRQADDSLSQQARGLFEAVTPSDVGDAGMRQAWVNAQVEAKATPQHQVTFDPSSTAPTFGTDYEVGDTVTARGIYAGTSRFNGTVRVFKVEISIDEQGVETVSPVLTFE